jgi:hypothetical protein
MLLTTATFRNCSGKLTSAGQSWSKERNWTELQDASTHPAIPINKEAYFFIIIVLTEQN